MKILNFQTFSCGQCRMVELQLQKENIRHEIIDCSSEDGSMEAKYYNISHVPCIIIIDNDSKEVKRFSNMPAILQALKAGELNISDNRSGLLDFD